MIIYNGNDYPLFVDGTGKNDYFPSLYVAIAYETLIKVVDINEGVESYIYNGANLMWPGVRDITSLGNFLKDQVVGIRTAKGDIVAIGALGCSLKELQSNADNSGVAVYILHYLNDKLWETGPKTKP
jgi:translation initiation factor 2D